MWAAQHAPESWRPGIGNFANNSLNFFDWYLNKPEQCDCTPKDIPGQSLNSINILLQVYWGGKATTSVRRVGLYSVERVLSSSWTWETAVAPAWLDVTNFTWQPSISGLSRTNVARTLLSGGSVSVSRTSGLSRQIIQNMRLEWGKGIRGLPGALLGSGVADGFFQGLSDWNNGMCFSRSERWGRIAIATLFGLAGASASALVAAVAAALGAPALLVAAVGVGTGLAVSYGLNTVKEKVIFSHPAFGG